MIGEEGVKIRFYKKGNKQKVKVIGKILRESYLMY
jgi:hypothetical protein